MPRPPKTKALEEALAKGQAAREDCAQAFEGLLSQLDLAHLSPLVPRLLSGTGQLREI